MISEPGHELASVSGGLIGLIELIEGIFSIPSGNGQPKWEDLESQQILICGITIDSIAFGCGTRSIVCRLYHINVNWNQQICCEW